MTAAITVERKHCTTCEETLPITEFYKDRSRADGHQARCKECSKAYTRRYYETHREDRRAYNIEWQRRNKDKVASYRRRNKTTS